MSLLLTLLGAFLVSYFGAIVFRSLAFAVGLVDVPNARSSHSTPTPRGGGVVIVAVTLSTATLYAFLVGEAVLIGFVLGGLLVGVVSLLDDLYSVPPPVRLLVHSLAAGLVVYTSGGFQLLYIPYVGQTGLHWVGFGLSFLWIVWLVNAYNFMDGIDGIAALQALIAGVSVGGAALLLGDAQIAFISSVLAATSLAVLIQNWSPARIFLGDVGSAFLGFSLATLPMFISVSDATEPKLPIFAVGVVWPFVFDAFVTLIHRAWRLQPLWQAHREHIYQRLVIAGWPHGAVSALYGATSFAVAISLLWWVSAELRSGFYVLSAVTLSTFALLFALILRDRLAGSPLVLMFKIKVRESDG